MFWGVPLFWQGLFVAGVTIGAGLSLFVFALNRKLSHVEFLHRRVLAGGVLASLLLAGITGSATALEALKGTALHLYLLLPGSVLLLLLVGEIRLVIQHWQHRADPPVQIENFRFAGGELVRLEKSRSHNLDHAKEPLTPAPLPRREGKAERKGFRLITTTDLRVVRYEVEVSLPGFVPGAAPETVKVVQLSDFHFSPRLPYAYFRSAVELAGAQGADLVLLTGDFITFAEDAQRLPELFAGLAGRLGVFATLGNHDYWAGKQPTLDALQKAGVHLIRNDCRRLPLRPGLDLCLCGCDDPWGVPSWQPPVLQPTDLNLIISHSSDNIYRLRLHPFAGVFSGHFHGGQVRIPGFGALVVPSIYGRRFNLGHYQFKNPPRSDLPAARRTHLFVSAGVGSATPLLRILCQPDILVVTFRITG